MEENKETVSAYALEFPPTALAGGFKCRSSVPSIDILLNPPPPCSPVSPGATLTPVQVFYSVKRSRVSKPVIHNGEHNLLWGDTI